jgi:cytoskeletal protein RodZ
VFEIGSSLRDARARTGLDLQQLEVETKIRAKYLRALEEERFELLPGETYVKGFLRIYAERLGLDGQLYVDEYNSRFSLAEEPVLATRTGGRSRQGRFETHAVLIALAGIVAVTVLVIAAWQLGGSGEPATEQTPPGSATATGAQPGTTAAESIEAQPVRLLLTAAAGRSRVEVRQASETGKLLYGGMLEKGKSKPFEAEKQLWVFIAKPSNVTLRLNGAPVDELGGGPTAVVVTADGVHPADS